MLRMKFNFFDINLAVFQRELLILLCAFGAMVQGLISIQLAMT